jgi:phosphate transport system substrate-binding protein
MQVNKRIRSIGVALAATALFAGAATAQSVDLNGAGATFPYPIYSKWFADYATSTGIKINYQSIGSGGGIRQLSEQTVDFGASDSPMSDQELANAKGGPVLHFPTDAAAAVVHSQHSQRQQAAET